MNTPFPSKLTIGHVAINYAVSPLYSKGSKTWRRLAPKWSKYHVCFAVLESSILCSAGFFGAQLEAFRPRFSPYNVTAVWNPQRWSWSPQFPLIVDGVSRTSAKNISVHLNPTWPFALWLPESNMGDKLGQWASVWELSPIQLRLQVSKSPGS